MAYSNNDLLELQKQAQDAIYEGGNKYGRIGVPSATGFSIPSGEQGMRLISVTLEDGTLVKADAARVMPAPGAAVRLRKESGKWVIKGADEREALLSASNATIALPKHSHNIGSPPGMFYPVDPASINDGLLLPTGNDLEVTVGRVTYPKSDGTIGIYDASDTLDFASAVSDLTDPTDSRWSIVYILKTDGSVNIHNATKDTAPLNTTTDLEAAIAECLDTVSNSYPYHAVRMVAGMSIFGSYKGMTGRNMNTKDFIRLGNTSGGDSTPATEAIDKIVVSHTGEIVVSHTGSVVYGH